MTFRPAASTLRELPLHRSMSDREILAELQPSELGLGELFLHLHGGPLWPWSLCYIRDRWSELQSVHWLLQDGEWYIDCPDEPKEWSAIYRVLSRAEPGWLGRLSAFVSRSFRV